MIVCATPRCGGTIFCIEKAKMTGAQFYGELSMLWVQGIAPDPGAKARLHETGFQPTFTLNDYVSHLAQVDDPAKIYLVNSQVSFALPQASHFISTRDLYRACVSLSNIMLQARQELPDNARAAFVMQHVTQQILTDRLIRGFCAHKGITPLIYEDMYKSKTQYAAFERFRLRNALDQAIRAELKKANIG